MRKHLLLALLLAGSRLHALPAPDFDVTDSDGNQHSLYGDYVSQGKVLVIEIFFVNCPPCATHAPHFQSLYTSKKSMYPGKVEFMLLTTMSGDHDPQVAQYKINKSMTMPAVSSDGGSLQAIAPYQSGTFGAFLGTPTFIVIAPNSGEVFFDIRGSSPQATMSKISQLVDHLLVPASPLNVCGAASPTGAPLDSVRYHVDAPGWDTTFWAGDYNLWNFAPLQITQPYTITPYKNDHHKAGISTFDLVLMSKHILGITPFDASWKTSAADVNLSGSVTTFDIVETRKVLLGVYDTFTYCTSWRFVPTSGSDVNGYCFPFQCIKMGDVNGSYSANGNTLPEERQGESISIFSTDRQLTPGESVDLPLDIRGVAEWEGLQMAIRFDPSLIEIQQVSSSTLPAWGPDNLNFLPDGQIRVSWSTAGLSARIQAGAPFLTLRVRALQTTRLSEALSLDPAGLRAEAYDRVERVYPFEWQWEASPMPVCRLTPNPARESFNIEMYRSESGTAALQLIDTQGREVWREVLQTDRGVTTHKVQTGTLAPGLYFVVLDGQPAGKVLLGE